MVYNVDKDLARAEEHISSGDLDRLRYACLELRIALEKIAYKKLQLRLDHISIEEIGSWQPKRVMDRLMELVDDFLTRDAILQVALEDEPGVEAKEGFSTIGENKGVSPKHIGKHWQKLSSYLHVRMPKTKKELNDPFDHEKLRAYLVEVSEYVKQITDTGFDFYFSQNVTLECGTCGKPIVRNRDLLQDGSIVQCQNQNCNASYIVNINDDEYEYAPYTVPLDCNACGEKSFVPANVFLEMKPGTGKTVICTKCGSRYLARWLLQFSLNEEMANN